MSASSKQDSTSEDPEILYQRALKLLQDPIFPVRAHGLLLLRELVSPRVGRNAPLHAVPVNAAYIPAILDIFMQTIQDDDSYMYLNAVQGLSAMVDGFGKDVLMTLVKSYTGGLSALGASTLTEHDLNLRIRIGEALDQVIRRCGDALPSYGK